MYNYKQYRDEEGNISNEGIIRLLNNVWNAWIPNEPANRDWKEYQAWLEAGNTPLPPDDIA